MWKTLSREVLFETRFFKFVREKCLTHHNKEMPSYYRLEAPDWVHVIAVTKDQQILLVRQYRHGAYEEFVEWVGGASDPGEDPLVAAKRELREETGFRSESWSCLGAHFPNPALQNNKTWIYLALECQKEGEPELDPFEELEVERWTLKEIRSHLKSQPNQHSLMLATWCLAEGQLGEIL